MNLGDLSKVLRRNLARRPLRSGLTVLGIALAVTLQTGIEAFSTGMDLALESGDKQRTLIVYREDRFCPQTSYLPERYAEEIAALDGVDSVLPVKVFLNNCRTNLDMITFHGAPVEQLLQSRELELLSGSIEEFRSEPDAALVGQGFAQRRGLKPGDRFRFGEVEVKVAGTYASPDSTEEALILVHLEFLQRAGPIKRLGTVTQFEVKVDDPSKAKSIADEIDRRLATAEEPTKTRLLAEFLRRSTRDLREILAFARIFGWACVIVVITLVATTIYSGVHERRRELGVLRAIGFRPRQLIPMVLSEAALLAFLGALIGLGALLLLMAGRGLAVGVEGIQVGLVLTPLGLVSGLIGTILAALLAALLPALAASHADLLGELRGGSS